MLDETYVQESDLRIWVKNQEFGPGSGSIKLFLLGGGQGDCFHSRRVVSTPAGLFPLQRAFSRVQTTLIFARLDEIPVSSIFKFILSSYWEKVWSSPILEWKNPFLEISPSE